ncbi:MAG: hypothetical protein J7K95_05720 [Thermoplasmata archaeon]|nr:hypothetical protein [Thermoplasmata archaeon]
MEKLKLNVDWLDELLPEGFPLHTSTLVSGPGGSGKPLIGYIFASSFLKQGGNLIMILTSTTKEYVVNVMKIFGLDLTKYDDRITYIELDVGIEEIEKIDRQFMKANLLKPDVWDAIQEYIHGNEMVVASALNLLFFSKTYSNAIYEKLKDIIKNDKSTTYFFTINSDAFKEKAVGLEKAADNLMFSRMEKPMKLFLRIERMKEVGFFKKKVEVPLSPDILKSIKEEAEKGKRNLIPTISKI